MLCGYYSWRPIAANTRNERVQKTKCSEVPPKTAQKQHTRSRREMRPVSTPLLHNVGHIALQAPRADGRFTVSTTTLVSYLRASALQPPDSVPSWSTFPSLSPRCISRCTFCREASSSPGTFALVYWPLGVQPVHSLGVPSRCIFRVYVSEQAPVPTRCTLLVQFPSVPFAFALGS